MFKYNIKEINNHEVEVIFTPIIANIETSIHLKNPATDGTFTKFYTATTQMKDFIGNITFINNNKCFVRGVYNGKIQEIKNICLYFPGAKVGDRVMVTEHLDIDGRLEFIATKNRILQGDLNFINCGWKNNKKISYFRIDIYTGKTKLIVTGE